MPSNAEDTAAAAELMPPPMDIDPAIMYGIGKTGAGSGKLPKYYTGIKKSDTGFDYGTLKGINVAQFMGTTPAQAKNKMGSVILVSTASAKPRQKRTRVDKNVPGKFRPLLTEQHPAPLYPGAVFQATCFDVVNKGMPPCTRIEVGGLDFQFSAGPAKKAAEGGDDDDAPQTTPAPAGDAVAAAGPGASYEEMRLRELADRGNLRLNFNIANARAYGKLPEVPAGVQFVQTMCGVVTRPARWCDIDPAYAFMFANMPLVTAVPVPTTVSTAEVLRRRAEYMSVQIRASNIEVVTDRNDETKCNVQLRGVPIIDRRTGKAVVLRTLVWNSLLRQGALWTTMRDLGNNNQFPAREEFGEDTKSTLLEQFLRCWSYAWPVRYSPNTLRMPENEDVAPDSRSYAMEGDSSCYGGKTSKLHCLLTALPLNAELTMLHVSFRELLDLFYKGKYERFAAAQEGDPEDPDDSSTKAQGPEGVFAPQDMTENERRQLFPEANGDNYVWRVAVCVSLQSNRTDVPGEDDWTALDRAKFESTDNDMRTLLRMASITDFAEKERVVRNTHPDIVLATKQFRVYALQRNVADEAAASAAILLSGTHQFGDESLFSGKFPERPVPGAGPDTVSMAGNADESVNDTKTEIGDSFAAGPPPPNRPPPPAADVDFADAPSPPHALGASAVDTDEPPAKRVATATNSVKAESFTDSDNDDDETPARTPSKAKPKKGRARK